MKELVTKMSGIEQLLEGISDVQLEAMSGGETLKSEALSFGQVRSSKKSAQRLVHALLDGNLAMKLAVLIAKQRDACLFHIGIDHLKLISTQFDQIQETFLQYVNFIGSMEPKVYAKLTPPMSELCNQFSVDPDIAWIIIRPKIVQRMKEYAKGVASAVEEITIDTKSEESLSSDAINIETGDQRDEQNEEENDGRAQNEAAAMNVDSGAVAQGPVAGDTAVWQPALQTVIEEVSSIFPDKVTSLLR